MIQKTCINTGEKAKDFSLSDQNKNKFILSKHKGKKILLSFHPLAWTPVCAQQMKSLEDKLEVFEQLQTIAVGVSIDSVPSKKAWAKTLNITHTQLLCDFWPHGGVAQQLGIFRDEGFSERANIIIDEQGVVEYIQIYPISQLPDINEIITVLKTMSVK
ncbi:MAG: redoxin domain-containing protein [Thermoplasmatota archaeon]